MFINVDFGLICEIMVGQVCALGKYYSYNDFCLDLWIHFLYTHFFSFEFDIAFIELHS